MIIPQIKLYQFPAPDYIPNLSPFCMKLAAYLQLAKLPYKTVTTMKMREGPTKKLPYVSIDGRLMGDSGFIIDHLEKRTPHSLDKTLSESQRASALALRRLLEEHLYFVLVYSRWLDPVGWAKIKPMFFNFLPKPFRFVAGLIRRKVYKQLYLQGTARHPMEKVYQMGIDDIHALAAMIQDSQYIFGEKPTTIDACAYAFIGSIWFMPWDYPLKQALVKHPQCLAYYQRMGALCFPEYPTEPEVPVKHSQPQ